VIYLSWLGRQGMVELAELLVRRTAYARERLQAVQGVSLVHAQPVVREFAISLDAPVGQVIERCRRAGVNPGYRLDHDYPELSGGLLVALTERRTRADVDRLCEVLSSAVEAERPRVEAQA
jgi:glycine dehydrogenase subunit 1